MCVEDTKTPRPYGAGRLIMSMKIKQRLAAKRAAATQNVQAAALELLAEEVNRYNPTVLAMLADPASWATPVVTKTPKGVAVCRWEATAQRQLALLVHNTEGCYPGTPEMVSVFWVKAQYPIGQPYPNGEKRRGCGRRGVPTGAYFAEEDLICTVESDDIGSLVKALAP